MKVPKAISAYFDISSIPNQITNSGRSAILGIGKSAATSGTSAARAYVKSPITSPTATPALTPITAPTKRRISEGPRCSQRRPDSAISQSVSATSEGRGRVSVPIQPARVPHSASAISSANTTGPTQTTRRGRKPPPL